MKQNICEISTSFLCFIENIFGGQNINIHLLTDAAQEQLHILKKTG